VGPLSNSSPPIIGRPSERACDWGHTFFFVLASPPAWLGPGPSQIIQRGIKSTSRTMQASCIPRGLRYLKRLTFLYIFNKKPQINYALKIGLSVTLVGLKRPAQELPPMLYISKFGKICIVCHRIANMTDPKVPSVRRKCAYCRASIWVTKESPAGPPKVCLACAAHFGASTAQRPKSNTDMHQCRRGRRLH
jgi:hypothetical protein